MKKNLVILVVEDDEVDVMSITRTFKKNNIPHHLCITHDGQDAVCFLTHQPPYDAPDSAPRPNLILLDLKLPIMDGHEVLAFIKNSPDLCEIPVVMLTSSRHEMDIKKCYKHGAAGYLVKPVSFDDYESLICVLDLYWTHNELP